MASTVAIALPRSDVDLESSQAGTQAAPAHRAASFSPAAFRFLLLSSFDLLIASRDFVRLFATLGFATFATIAILLRYLHLAFSS